MNWIAATPRFCFSFRLWRRLTWKLVPGSCSSLPGHHVYQWTDFPNSMAAMGLRSSPLNRGVPLTPYQGLIPGKLKNKNYKMGRFLFLENGQTHIPALFISLTFALTLVSTGLIFLATERTTNFERSCDWPSKIPKDLKELINTELYTLDFRCYINHMKQKTFNLDENHWGLFSL